MLYIASMTTRAPLVEIQFVGRVMVIEGEVSNVIERRRKCDITSELEGLASKAFPSWL